MYLEENQTFTKVRVTSDATPPIDGCMKSQVVMIHTAHNVIFRIHVRNSSNQAVVRLEPGIFCSPVQYFNHQATSGCSNKCYFNCCHHLSYMFQVEIEQNLLQALDQGQLLESYPISTHPAVRSNVHPLNVISLNSHSLSLRPYQRRDRSRLPGHHTKSLTLSSTQGVHSLSYDSLHSPTEVPFQMTYHPPSLPAALSTGISTPTDLQQVPVHTCSPVFMGTSNHSPVEYDSLPKHSMSSIEERYEQEAPTLAQTWQTACILPHASVYDIPSGWSVACRGPTPPTYGSREFILSSATYGYASSLRRTSKTSNVTLHSRSLSPSACRSLELQTHCSTSSIPYPMPSSSYTTQRALALVISSDRKDLPPKYES